MSDGPAVDTDILLKVSAYNLASDLTFTVKPHGVLGALGLTHLIAAGQLRRMRGLRDPHGASATLKALLKSMSRFEPSDAEIKMSAEFSETAQVRGLALDRGEAQLVAITISRGLPLLLTGDKRAIGAISHLFDKKEARGKLVGRLVCLEQIIAAVAQRVGANTVRMLVCAEPDIDGAMRLACSCGSADWNQKHLSEACASFVGSVKAVAHDLLADDSSLA